MDTVDSVEKSTPPPQSSTASLVVQPEKSQPASDTPSSTSQQTAESGSGLGGPGQYLNHGKWKYFMKSLPAEVRAQLWIDKEAVYSVTEERCANSMTDMLNLFFEVPGTAPASGGAVSTTKRPRILDATSCVGGNSFSLQKKFDLIACEFDPIRYKMLQHNMRVLGAPVEDPERLRYAYRRRLLRHRRPNMHVYASEWYSCSLISADINHLLDRSHEAHKSINSWCVCPHNLECCRHTVAV